MDQQYMNFLAHLHLSGDSDKVKIGNFIGDFVKGKDLEKYEPEIAKGIRLHRAIDLFTDTHPVVRESKSRLRQKYRHYSGVIVDVYYDHFLASNWERFSRIPLDQFTSDSYMLISANLDRLPKRIENLLYYMQRDNWLLNYQYIDGIRRALTGMSHRTRFESKMEEAHLDLETDHQVFEEHFLTFYPDLQREAKRFLDSESAI